MWLKVKRMPLVDRERVLRLLVGHEKLIRVDSTWEIGGPLPTAVLRRCSHCRGIALINMPANEWQCDDCDTVSEVKENKEVT